MDIISKSLDEKFRKIEQRLREDFGGLRTGRVASSLVENIQVSYYGSTAPLNQMASISTPDASQIIIQPWDKNSLGDIELAIQNSDLNIAPINDGLRIRIVLPQMTEDRRKELTKAVKSKAEEAKIAARNVRKEIWDKIQQQEKNGEITEDDRDSARDKLDEKISLFNDKIQKISDEKEKDILTV